MGVKSVIGKIGGFVTGFLPTIMQFGEVFDLVLRMIKIGVAKEDVARLDGACDALDALGTNLSDLAGEVHDLSLALRSAIDEAGDGGKDITGEEARTLIDEAADIAPELNEIRRDLTVLATQIKAAL